mgnify:CR=1 FL=1
MDFVLERYIKNKYIGDNTAISTIGDGTLSGAVSKLNNDLTASDSLTFNFEYDSDIDSYGFIDKEGEFMLFGGAKPKLLWTNPNPTSALNPTTLDVDLSKFNYIIVQYRGLNSSSDFHFELIKKNFNTQILFGTPAALGSFRRDFNSTDTTISILNGYAVNSSGAWYGYANAVIPYQIFGISLNL